MTSRPYDLLCSSGSNRFTVSLLLDSQERLYSCIPGVINKYEISAIHEIYYKPAPWKRMPVQIPKYSPFVTSKKSIGDPNTTTKGDFGESLSSVYARTYILKKFFHGSNFSKISSRYHHKTSNPSKIHGIDHIFIYECGRDLTILVVDSKTDSAELKKGQMSYQWIKERLTSIQRITSIKSREAEVISIMQRSLILSGNKQSFISAMKNSIEMMIKYSNVTVGFQVWKHDFNDFTTELIEVKHDEDGNVCELSSIHKFSNKKMVMRNYPRFVRAVGLNVNQVEMSV